MAKEDKYIVLAIVLPVLAMFAIGFDLFKALPQAASSILLLVLLLPTPLLIYLAKREVFKPASKRVSLHDSGKRHEARAVVEDTSFNKQLRKLAIVLGVVGTPLVTVAWQIIRKTNRAAYYVLGGFMLLIGVVLMGASVGILKAVNE